MPVYAALTNWLRRRPISAPPVLERIEPEDALAELRSTIDPHREALLAHPLYAQVTDLPRLRRFMRSHVFAVWDFMCLAKRLQRDLTSLEVLWRPPQSRALARFINEIITAEESDVGPDGEPVSHLELYLSAMDEVGAPRAEIDAFLEMIAGGERLDRALIRCGAPAHVRGFVANTLAVVERGTTVEVLAAFLYGREDLIPDMFQRLLVSWRQRPTASRFVYYVQRHIDLDGGEHGPAGLRALGNLAGDDPEAWRNAGAAAASAIAARISLWDGVVSHLK